MNDKLDFIFSRRSVRLFTDDPVPENLIDDILMAGMSAPSARAKDPWRFVVLREAEDLEAMLKIVPNGAMLKSATAAFLVCGDIDTAHDNYRTWQLLDRDSSAYGTDKAASTLFQAARQYHTCGRDSSRLSCAES